MTNHTDDVSGIILGELDDFEPVDATEDPGGLPVISHTFSISGVYNVENNYFKDIRGCIRKKYTFA